MKQMEHLSDSLVQAQKNLQDYQQPIISKGKSEVSLYQGDIYNSETWAECNKIIQKAFPKLPIGWYEVLRKAIKEEEFTNERLLDATNNLIKTCIYPEPTIANMLGYDKTTKIYTYGELLELTAGHNPSARKSFLESFVAVDVGTKLRRFVKEEYASSFKKWDYNKAH